MQFAACEVDAVEGLATRMGEHSVEVGPAGPELKPLGELTLTVRWQGAYGGGTQGDAAPALLCLGFSQDVFFAWQLLPRRPHLERGAHETRRCRNAVRNVFVTRPWYPGAEAVPWPGERSRPSSGS